MTSYSLSLPYDQQSEPITYGRGNIRISRRGSSGSILLTALSRPQVKNAFSFDTYLDLVDLLDEVSRDDTISALVLTGTGNYFSSGADLSEATFFPEDGDANFVSTENRPPGKFMSALLRFPKVVAAAVNGPAVGIGVTLVMHCDLCYCAEGATFWAPFSRLALVPEFCSSVTFADTMGMAKANELLLLGKKIDAETAEKWNICSKIVTDCNSIHDPFHKLSIGNVLCSEINDKLISLPLGGETAKVFVEMVRGRRRSRLEKICNEELAILDRRINDGDCLEAATQLNFAKSKL